MPADDKNSVHHGSTNQPPKTEGIHNQGDSIYQTAAQVGADVARSKALSGASDADSMDRTEAQRFSNIIASRHKSRGAPLAPGYDVREKLGEGTYGEVWLAHEEKTGKQVAIKFYAHGTDQRWQMLTAEVKQLAHLYADQGIVQLLDVEPSASPPYYVMSLAEQGSLAKRLKSGPLPIGEAIKIFRQAAEALAYVHAKGIRHCDLKPANILLNARGRALLADFGQAHLSCDASPALGTFFYMAPEQANLEEHIPDTRWDVYSLGAVLYSMLTGHPPREDSTLRGELEGTVELAHRLKRYREGVRSSAQPTAHRRVPGIDRSLVKIIDKCLEINPERRFRDAGALLEALAGRDRRRRQRPLLAFGFVAPILLLLVMAVLAFLAIKAAVVKSQDTLVNQLLKTDLVGARLAANVVEDEMVDRIELIERIAGHIELRQAVKNRQEQELQKVLEKESKLETGHRIFRRTVTDAKGVMLASYPFDPTIQLQRFSWRDWFNGKGDQLNRKDQDFPPIVETHVSQPFVGRSREKGMLIGVSTPIFDPDEELDGKAKTVVGVLMMSVEMEEVHRWLKDVEIDNAFAILLNERGQCLLHQESEEIMPRENENPRSWYGPADSRFAQNPDGRIPSYVDPVDQKTYLAGYATFGARPELQGRLPGWGAIVQHERQPALKPVDDLRRQMVFIGWITLFVVALLTCGMWAGLLWWLRREERMIPG